MQHEANISRKTLQDFGREYYDVSKTSPTDGLAYNKNIKSSCNNENKSVMCFALSVQRPTR